MRGLGRWAVLAVLSVGLVACEVEATSPDDEAGASSAPVAPSPASDPFDAIVFVELEGAAISRAAGVVVDDAGHIAAVLHGDEVASGQRVTIIPTEGEGIDADVIGADPRTGITVVRVSDPTSLVPAMLGDSDQVAAGDKLVVVGAAGDRVSGAVRDTGVLSGAVSTIAIDAAVEHGGVVATDDGEVQGLIVGSSVGGDVEASLVLPINLLIRVTNQLIAGEAPAHPYLGVSVESAPGGVVVRQTVAGSPADGAGLQPGDLITALQGRPVEDTGDLIAIVQQAEVGQDITVTYQRGDTEHEVTVTVTAAPE